MGLLLSGNLYANDISIFTFTDKKSRDLFKASKKFNELYPSLKDLSRAYKNVPPLCKKWGMDMIINTGEVVDAVYQIITNPNKKLNEFNFNFDQYCPGNNTNLVKANSKSELKNLSIRYLKSINKVPINGFLPTTGSITNTIDYKYTPGNPSTSNSFSTLGHQIIILRLAGFEVNEILSRSIYSDFYNYYNSNKTQIAKKEISETEKKAKIQTAKKESQKKEKKRKEKKEKKRLEKMKAESELLANIENLYGEDCEESFFKKGFKKGTKKYVNCLKQKNNEEIAKKKELEVKLAKMSQIDRIEYQCEKVFKFNTNSVKFKDCTLKVYIAETEAQKIQLEKEIVLAKLETAKLKEEAIKSKVEAARIKKLEQQSIVLAKKETKNAKGLGSFLDLVSVGLQIYSLTSPTPSIGSGSGSSASSALQCFTSGMFQYCN